jgi:uncharacterized protein DUF4214
MDDSRNSDRHVVTMLYRTLLCREPDAEGMELYVNRLAGGSSRIDAAQSLLLCEEYGRRNRSDREFIADVYSAILGREPSNEDDVDLWLEKVQRQGRGETVLAFCKMPEVIRKYAGDDSFLCEAGPFAEAGLVLREGQLLLFLTTLSGNAPFVIDRTTWPAIKPFLDQSGLYAVVLQAGSILDGISETLDATRGLKRRPA